VHSRALTAPIRQYLSRRHRQTRRLHLLLPAQPPNTAFRGAGHAPNLEMVGGIDS